METFYAYVHWRPKASQDYRCLKSLVLLALCAYYITYLYERRFLLNVDSIETDDLMDVV
jgi:hypothetical protein